MFRYKMKGMDEESNLAPSAGGRTRRRLKRWEADYNLETLDRLHLFDEYIEMGEPKSTSKCRSRPYRLFILAITTWLAAQFGCKETTLERAAF